MTADEKPAFDLEQYGTALRFAAEIHAGQEVPGTKLPYLVHVVRVAAHVIASTEGEGRELRNLAIACALLHDAVEDVEPAARSAVRGRISAELGPEVLAGVDALTKDEGLPKGDRMRDSLARIRAQPRAVWIVKLCDRLVNLDPPPRAWSEEKVCGYAEEAREILAALGDVDVVLARRFEEKLRRYEERIESRSR